MTAPGQLSSRDSELTISSSTPPNRSTIENKRRSDPPLPPGCSYGTLTLDQALNLPDATEDEKNPQRQVIWVDFAPSSPENPFFFSKVRKRAIICVAVFFTGVTALNTSAYSIGEQSMSRDLGLNSAEAASGLALYAWVSLIVPIGLLCRRCCEHGAD